jgi:hypothetical protein
MFNRLSRSWALVRASGAVLMQDRSLLLFPLLSGVASLAVLASFALPAVGMLALDGGDLMPVSSTPLYALGFLFYLVQYFVIFFFNTALVAAAMRQLDGGRATLGEGLRVAGSRLGSILGYACLAATVGLLLRMLQERVGFIGRIVVGLLGAGWSLATFMVVPVLVARNVGPFEAVSESTGLLKRTWGENLVGQAGLGMAFGLLQFVLVLASGAVVVGAAMTGSAALVVLAIVAGLAVFLLSVLVYHALAGIYAAALYRYATQGDGALGFGADALRQAFIAKG